MAAFLWRVLGRAKDLVEQYLPVSPRLSDIRIAWEAPLDALTDDAWRGYHGNSAEAYERNHPLGEGFSEVFAANWVNGELKVELTRAVSAPCHTDRFANKAESSLVVRARKLTEDDMDVARPPVGPHFSDLHIECWAILRPSEGEYWENSEAAPPL